MDALSPGPWPTEDPWLFAVYHLDHFPPGDASMGPDPRLLRGRRLGSDFGNQDWNMYHGETIPGFPKHPHRGFETVTVVRRGRIDHTDSLGGAGRFGGGDVQWMTAGAGISHSEMFPLLQQDKENVLELFQIWLNLPKKDKMAAPHYKMLWNEQLPPMRTKDAAGKAIDITVVAGSLSGCTPPPAPPPASWGSDPANHLSIWMVRMDPGATWQVPPGPANVNRALYFYHGASGTTVAGQKLSRSSKVRVRPDAEVEVCAGGAEVEILMLQGKPIGEPVVQHGPFVMTTSDEIRQAFVDYQRTQFGKWPWPTDSEVHPRTEDRFAKYPDGHTERPGEKAR